MRLVAWNCNMALHRKLDPLLALKADIVVLSECARPEIVREKCADWGKHFESDAEVVWIGSNKQDRKSVV